MPTSEPLLHETALAGLAICEVLVARAKQRLTLGGLLVVGKRLVFGAAFYVRAPRHVRPVAGASNVVKDVCEDTSGGEASATA